MTRDENTVKELTEALPRYLTLHQAAEVADVCYQTIWRYVKRYRQGEPGGLRAVRRGAHGHWKVSERDLMTWAYQRNGSPEQ